jgi:aminopeptidase-like protein
MSDASFLSELYDALFPILRSLTGPGVTRTLAILGGHMPLEVETVASGAKVFDWTVPPSWHCRSAVLTGPDGTVLADLATSTLSVVNYAEPVDVMLDLADLQPHLHSLPALPDAVPYVTSYYKRAWGFCLPHGVRATLPPGRYHARIDSEFRTDSGVQVAQAVLPGESDAEILLSSYVCHPSMANNELSGPLTLVGLYRRLVAWPRRRFTYRFVLHPETIGSLCFLANHAEHVRTHMTAGMVLNCTGGTGEGLSYKLSRRGDGLLDRLMTHLAALPDQGRADTGLPVTLRPFDPTGGSDERQYNAPGFNFPFGQLARTPPGTYQAYHTSLDTKEYMGIDKVVGTIDALERVLSLAEIGAHYVNLAPYGEPQLGRRDLYPNTNSRANEGASADHVTDGRTFLNRILYALNYADGRHDGLEIAAKCGAPIGEMRAVVETLERNELLRFVGGPSSANPPPQ